MSFSQNTINLMDIFIKDFETKYLKIKSKSDRSKFDKIIKKLYGDMNAAEISYKYLMKHEKITMKKSILTNKSKLPYTNLLMSSYVPKDIIETIRNTSIATIEYNIELGGKHITVHFLIFNEEDLTNTAKFEHRLKLIIMWLSIALSYSTKSCGQHIKLFLYLTPILKKLPNNKLDILSQEHCNTAVTTACEKDGEVLIFREEEWFKVLIHETFHLLCLDFANMPSYILSEFNKKIRQLMPLRSEYNIYEAYSEFWATMWNCSFCSYKIIEKRTFEEYASYMDLCIQSETLFAIFQMNKILDFMGLSYEQLYNRKEESGSSVARKYLYRENTNVFAYYIIKTIMLFYHVEFLEWCDIHNGTFLVKFKQTKANLMYLAKFIETHYNDDTFLKVISDVDILLHKSKNMKNKEILSTMRMTACELEE